MGTVVATVPPPLCQLVVVSAPVYLVQYGAVQFGYLDATPGVRDGRDFDPGLKLLGPMSYQPGPN